MNICVRKKLCQCLLLFLLYPSYLLSQQRHGYFEIEDRATGLGKSVKVMVTPRYDMDIKPHYLKIAFLIVPTQGDCNSLEDRAIKVWERLNTGLDIYLKQGGRLIVADDEKGNPAIYVTAGWLMVPHRIISIFPDDINYFGDARTQSRMANYLRDLLYAFWTFFYNRRLPTGPGILSTRDGQIITALFISAREHASIVRHSNSIIQDDIQTAINMCSESQRNRLNLLSFVIPRDYP